MKKIIILFCLLFSTNYAFSQQCDRVYQVVDTLACYSKGTSTLSMFDFLNNEITPVFKECIDTEKQCYPTRLLLSLIIDKEGNVVEIKHLIVDLEENCKEALSKSILKSKWNPAVLQGKKVCSRLDIPFSCLRWE